MHNLLWALAWFVVLGIVVLSLYSFATRVQSDTRFERIKASADLSLLMSAAPTPAPSYFLPLFISPWRIRFENGRVHAIIFERGEGAAGTSTRLIDESAPYTISGHVPLTSQEIQPKTQADLFKTGTRIIIQPRGTKTTATEPPSLNTLACPPNPLTDQDTIIIDPGHGGITTGGTTTGDTGTQAGAKTEAETTTLIANEILAGIHTAHRPATLTRPDNTPLDLPTRLDRIGATTTLISIHAHPSNEGHATVTALVKAPADTTAAGTGFGTKDSITIACNILNALIESNPLFITGGGNIVQIETSTLDPADDRHVLDKPRNGIYLIINGIELDSSVNPAINHETQIGKRIAEALTSQTQ